MDFGFSPEEEKFRQEVREFLRNEPIDEYPCEDEDEGYGFGGWSVAFARRLAEKGWIGLSWPKEYSGLGRSIIEQYIMWEEIGYAKAPAELVFYSQTVGEALVRGGTEELKRSLLPKAAAGEVSFWEGFSEPNAGSDLLSLTTRAVEDGDYYIINGQKTWNSNAHLATHGFTAARTDPDAPRHKGISLFLIDMKSPGIEVHPIKDMAGGEAFAEIFFEDTRVPKTNLIGELNQGLPFILGGLEWDRFWGRAVRSSYNRRIMEEVVAYCHKTEVKGKPISEDHLVRYKLAELAVEAEVCRLLFYRPLTVLNAGKQTSWESCWPKTFADELGQRFSNTVMQILGLYGQLEKGSKWAPFDGEMGRLYLNCIGHSIAGGTSEMERNTVATRGLRLPRG
ncbi:acyl-CoA dehydrogenase family protein [Candidatus Omnitrophota bacterium]